MWTRGCQVFTTKPVQLLLKNSPKLAQSRFEWVKFTFQVLNITLLGSLQPTVMKYNLRQQCWSGPILRENHGLGNTGWTGHPCRVFLHLWLNKVSKNFRTKQSSNWRIKKTLQLILQNWADIPHINVAGKYNFINRPIFINNAYLKFSELNQVQIKEQNLKMFGLKLMKYNEEFE